MGVACVFDNRLDLDQPYFFRRFVDNGVMSIYHTNQLTLPLILNENELRNAVIFIKGRVEFEFRYFDHPLKALRFKITRPSVQAWDLFIQPVEDYIPETNEIDTLMEKMTL
jgi:hypothetical protein